MWNVAEDQRVEVTSGNFAELLIASAKEALAIERGEMAPARVVHAATILPGYTADAKNRCGSQTPDKERAHEDR